MTGFARLGGYAEGDAIVAQVPGKYETKLTRVSVARVKHEDVHRLEDGDARVPSGVRAQRSHAGLEVGRLEA